MTRAVVWCLRQSCGDRNVMCFLCMMMMMIAFLLFIKIILNAIMLLAREDSVKKKSVSALGKAASLWRIWLSISLCRHHAGMAAPAKKKNKNKRRKTSCGKKRQWREEKGRKRKFLLTLFHSHHGVYFTPEKGAYPRLGKKRPGGGGGGAAAGGGYCIPHNQ